MSDPAQLARSLISFVNPSPAWPHWGDPDGPIRPVREGWGPASVRGGMGVTKSILI